MIREVWRAAVYGVAESDMAYRLNNKTRKRVAGSVITSAPFWAGELGLHHMLGKNILKIKVQTQTKSNL